MMYITHRDEERQRVLRDGWELGHTDLAGTSPPSDWLPAVMPAMVQLQWHLAGQAPDPYFGRNSDDYLWMEERAWWLRRRITRDEVPGDGEHVRLVFDGVDHDATVRLDGVEATSHRGAFGGPVVTLPDDFDAVEVLVRLEPRGTGRGHEFEWSTPVGPTAARLESLVKSEVMSRWIPNPHFMTTGIWRDVRLVATGKWAVERPFAHTVRIDDGAASVRVAFEVVHRDEPARADFVLRAHTTPPLHHPDVATFDAEPPADVRVVLRDPDGAIAAETTVAVARGHGREWYETTLDVADPRLWTVHTAGTPWRYGLELELREDGRLLDRVTSSFGIRTFELARTRTPRVSDRRADFLPVLNGEERRMFGVNWEPIDIFAADATRYRWFLELARDAGVDLIRVWGGGLLEDDVFYELCDELGIMVWQDFPVNCFSKADRADLRLWEEQVVQNVQRLRNHPSLAVWCGGNEFDPYDVANAGLVGVLERTVADFDGTRPWIRACPDGGDVHVYLDSDTTWYLPLYGEAAAVTEWGSHAMPHPATLGEFVPEHELAQPLGRDELMDDEAFTASHPNLLSHWAEFNPMRVPRMLQRGQVFGELTGTVVDEFVEAVNHGAAEVYETAARDLRAWAPDLNLMLLWVYNRPWPSVGMQLVDHAGRPNAGYYGVKRAYAARYVSATVEHEVVHSGETVTVRVGADERTAAGDGRVRVRVFDSALRPVRADDDVAHGAALEVHVPDEERHGVFVVADLRHGGGPLLHRSLRWLRCSPSLADPERRRDYRSRPQECLISDTTPARVAVLPHSTSCRAGVLEASHEADGAWRARLRITNDGPRPAVSVRVDVSDPAWLLKAEDNFVWIDSGESRDLAVVLRPARQIRAREVSGPPAGDVVRLTVSAWNAGPVTAALGAVPAGTGGAA